MNKFSLLEAMTEGLMLLMYATKTRHLLTNLRTLFVKILKAHNGIQRSNITLWWLPKVELYMVSIQERWMILSLRLKLIKRHVHRSLSVHIYQTCLRLLEPINFVKSGTFPTPRTALSSPNAFPRKTCHKVSCLLFSFMRIFHGSWLLVDKRVKLLSGILKKIRLLEHISHHFWIKRPRSLRER